MQTISKVYDSYPQAERAVTALEAAGVPSGDISLVANKHVSDKYSNADEISPTAAGAGIGAAVGGGNGLLTGLGLLAIPGLGPVVAAGWLATTALGAVAGSATGGVIRALVGAGTSEDDAHVYSEAVRRGGTLVTVRHSQSNGKVEGILNASNPIDPVIRRNEYREGGWNYFDAKAPAYQPDQTEIERMRRTTAETTRIN